MNNKLISIFKNVRDVSNPFNMPISYALNRIKDGNSKEIVEQIRSLKDKTQLNELKKQLPGVCFNGTFKHRSSNGLLERSGFMIIDFDDVDKAHEYKQHLIKDLYIYSAWISPSGMGVKVLVKIETTETHKGYFEALREHFNSPYWDDSGSNIDRFCFESYDPDIYINEKAQIWTKHEAPEMDDIGSEVE
jgi:hypothetical protein